MLRPYVRSCAVAMGITSKAKNRESSDVQDRFRMGLRNCFTQEHTSGEMHGQRNRMESIAALHPIGHAPHAESRNRSPAIDRRVVQIRRRTTQGGGHAVHLEIQEHGRSPAQRKRGWDSDVEVLLHAIEPHGLIGHIAGVVTRVLNLYMMPRVGCPVLWSASLVGVQPLV